MTSWATVCVLVIYIISIVFAFVGGFTYGSRVTGDAYEEYMYAKNIDWNEHLKDGVPITEAFDCVHEHFNDTKGFQFYECLKCNANL